MSESEGERSSQSKGKNRKCPGISQEKEEKQKPQKDLSVFYSDIENKLKSILGAKIAIKASNNDKGKIEINYYSQDELDRITEMLYSINKEMM